MCTSNLLAFPINSKELNYMDKPRRARARDHSEAEELHLRHDADLREVGLPLQDLADAILGGRLPEA